MRAPVYECIYIYIYMCVCVCVLQLIFRKSKKVYSNIAEAPDEGSMFGLIMPDLSAAFNTATSSV